MAEIGIQAVGINHYATSASNLVRMYTTNGSTQLLSLGQLVSAVMLRSAAASEARAIYKLNVLDANTSYQNILAYVGKIICDAADSNEEIKLKWNVSIAEQAKEFGYHAKSADFAATGTLKDFLLHDCGIPESALPNVKENTGLLDFQDCIDAYEQVKPVLEEATRQSSMTEAEMESAVSRRDVSFTTAANIVKSITGTSAYTAALMGRE